ncbi:MAG: DUF1549 domain-containing protein [Candidatus Hydrogenedentes bacterium]|nr:DUF1549 domain-containing protein [Candidatus Hydrogenedentota bacterium]
MPVIIPKSLRYLVCALVPCFVVAIAAAQEAGPQLPPPATHDVDFAKDIHPILAERCAECHLGGKTKGGLSMDSREALLKGGESGPVVQPGNSAESRLIRLVAGLEPDTVMPAKGEPLSAEQIGLLRAWIDQGVKWHDVTPPAPKYQAPIHLLRPEVPAEKPGLSNPIDRFIDAYFEQRGLVWPEPIADNVFLRRVSLDAVGLLPTPEELAAFGTDTNPEKHGQAASRLLHDNLAYAEHWMTFWNDHLRNDFAGTGYIDGGRKPITQWLFDALYQNMPYDQFVAQLIHPSSGSEGFVNGIVWRGVTAAAMVPPMQAAQTVSQVFLGVNLKCASCHDSFIDHWKLADSYGMAGVFAENPLELVRCDVAQGKTVPIKFLWDDLGAIDATRTKTGRQAQLARIVTSEENGFFTRAIVNRLWAKFMGRGFIEPLDVIENEPWYPELLDWLAGDLISHGYDLKRTMHLVLSSRIYRLPSVSTPPETKEAYLFRGPEVRRMNAEQFLDAVASLTGAWQENPQFAVPPKPVKKDETPPPPVVRAWRVKSDPLTRALGRPNREQVTTRRQSVATALEAVEMSNGQTLAALLERGAANIAGKPDQSTESLAADLYKRALQRDATEAERMTAAELMGAPPTAEGVADVLWALSMLPEFQLIF